MIDVKDIPMSDETKETVGFLRIYEVNTQGLVQRICENNNISQDVTDEILEAIRINFETLQKMALDKN